jgi:hypothetical protein
VKRLMALIRDHVGADLVVAGSNEAALAAMNEDLPDLILTPALFSHSEESELVTHLKSLPDSQHVQILTTPLLPDLEEAEAPQRGVLSFLRRDQRPPRVWSACDPDAYAQAILGYLERAEALQDEQKAWLSCQRHQPDPNGVSLVVAAESELLARRLDDERRRARRMLHGELPWLSRITLPWGLEVRPINISSTGVLVETSSKLSPGLGTEFRFSGQDSNLIAPVRFVRSQVAGVDARGVKYHAAAVFEKELDFLTPVGVFSTSKALGRLLGCLQSELDRDPGDARVRAAFVQGLRMLVPARDIQIRDVPAIYCDGTESIYFSVPRTNAVLQATFEPDYELAESEFRLLKAAAALSTVVMDMEAARRPGQDGSANTALARRTAG